MLSAYAKPRGVRNSQGYSDSGGSNVKVPPPVRRNRQAISSLRAAGRRPPPRRVAYSVLWALRVRVEPYEPSQTKQKFSCIPFNPHSNWILGFLLFASSSRADYERDGCLSGWKSRSWKPKYREYRGFESLSIRGYVNESTAFSSMRFPWPAPRALDL